MCLLWCLKMNQKYSENSDVVKPQECFNNKQKRKSEQKGGKKIIAALLLHFIALVIVQCKKLNRYHSYSHLIFTPYA